MDMKKCKECGKLFVPKSKNSVYCDAIHYRPCPVCGKLVEAKYLSDPPRTCSTECRKQVSKSSKHSVASSSVQVNVIQTGISNKQSSPTADKPKSLRSLFELPKTDNPIPENFMNLPELTGGTVTESIIQPESRAGAELDIEDIATVTSVVDMEYVETLRQNSDVRTYIGKNTSLKFIPGHAYALEISKDEYAYIIEASYDLTAGKAVDLYMPLSSQISIDQNFKKN